MLRIRKHILLILLIIPIISNAQINRWKRLRYEFFGGIGVTGFLGDLGGADQIGTHALKDMELSMTRPAFTIGGRYSILRRLAVVPHYHMDGSEAMIEKQTKLSDTIGTL